MRGFFEPVNSLIQLVELYCSRCDADCELLLFESYWAKGGTQLQLNMFEEGKDSFEKAYNLLLRAVEKGLITADDDRIAIACGLMGNGFMAENKFDEAEQWYLKAFHMWETMEDGVFQDKQLFVSSFASGVLW
jgi:tetratricopeptide (TPR) repeat protein